MATESTTTEATPTQVPGPVARRWPTREVLGTVVREWRWPAAAALLLAVLSLYQLGDRSLWRDEVASVLYASDRLRDLFTGLTTTEANQTVYYLLLHYWLKFGTDETWIRFLSLIFGVATVVPVYLIGRRLGGQLAGVIAAFVFAASRFVVRYDQEARQYSLAMLVAATLTWLLLRALDRPTVWRWAAYGVLAAVGIYVHFFILFVIAAHALFVVATRSWPRGRALLAAALPILLAGLPLPLILLAQGSVIAWIPPVTPQGAINTIQEVLGGQALLVVTIELLGLAIVLRARRPVVWLIVAWLVVPPAAAALISIVKPILIIRYLAIIVPAMAVLAGVALAAIRPRRVMAVCVVAVALLLVVALPQVYERVSEDWRAAAQWISASPQPGDRMVFQTHQGAAPTGYYLRRLGVSRPPLEVGLSRAEADPSGRVWLVMSEVSSSTEALFRARLEVHYTFVEERSFGGQKLRVALFVPSS